jgi:hypothetical protein
MDRESKQTLSLAIAEMRHAKAHSGKLVARDLACSVMTALSLENPDRWAAIRDDLALGAITNAVANVMRRAAALADDRQGWLDLPGYEAVPEFIEVTGGWMPLRDASLEQYRAHRKAFEKRLESYGAARRNSAKQRQDKKALTEIRRLERVLTPYFVGDERMTVGQALDLHKVNLKSSIADRNRLVTKNREKSRR